MQDYGSYNNISTEEKNLAMFAHLSTFAGFVFPLGNVLAPLIIWQLKKDQMKFVEDQAKEVLNFQLSMLIYFVVSAVLILVLIGIPLLIGFGLYYIIISIVAALQANSGVQYRYPMTIRFVV